MPRPSPSGCSWPASKGSCLADGLHQAGTKLGRTNSLIGTALQLLTNHAEGQETHKTSVEVLKRVVDTVVWADIADGEADAWLYFDEDFLEVYDPELRKRTGSYDTPPEVVSAMIRLVDEALRSRFSDPSGLGSPAVCVADPAVDTGTFLLGVLRRIAETVADDEGEGSGADEPAHADESRPLPGRLTAFELQLGPFAVAQLRIMAGLAALTGAEAEAPPRMFVTNTLASPCVEDEYLGAIAEPIARSRKLANRIKRREPITVVLGNPPCKEMASGMGGSIDSGAQNSPGGVPLDIWKPTADWGISAHIRHLHNLCIYFWRWGIWKVFDSDSDSNRGIICFSTPAGLIAGVAFQSMREHLRQRADKVLGDSLYARRLASRCAE